MRGRDMPWIVGLLAFPVVGLLFYQLSDHNAAAALLVGLVSAVVLALGVRYAFPVDPQLASYQVDARRRVAKVLDSVRRIQRMSGDVTDQTARTALRNGCARIPELLASVQQRDPTSVASIAAKLNVTTSGIQTTVAQYLEIQKDPDLYTDANALLATGQTGFANFEQFVVDTFRQLNDAEVISYKATLAALQPLEIKQLTT